MTFNTMMRMISGKRYYGEDCDVTDVEEARQFRAIIKELVALGGANNPGDFISVLRWFDFDGLENKLKRLSKRTDSFLQGLIDEHRSRKINTNTMIDHLLTQQQSHPEYYTDQIIKGLILVCFSISSSLILQLILQDATSFRMRISLYTIILGVH
ncbi:hypothetical protein Ahy_Scaffold1g106954 isoform G [Arachis hypogaea]|nr:hypothetical protein Ahy_Scaffold1g106954 isoform G [Arachis hypogaea]